MGLKICLISHIAGKRTWKKKGVQQLLHSLLFVCTGRHNRERQPQKPPLQALELLLSSKRDQCRAPRLHTTPSPPGNAEPGALTEQRTKSLDKNRRKMLPLNNCCLNYNSRHLRPIGASLFWSDFCNSSFFRWAQSRHTSKPSSGLRVAGSSNSCTCTCCWPWPSTSATTVCPCAHRTLLYTLLHLYSKATSHKARNR